QFHVVVQLAGGDGARAFLFDFGRARCTQAEVKIGGGNGKSVTGSLKQEIGKNGNGRLALHYSLGRGELSQKFGLAYADFHDALSPGQPPRAAGYLSHAYRSSFARIGRL